MLVGSAACSRHVPTHFFHDAHVCRFRGWHSSRVKRGNHYILVAPSFENSDVGRQYDKLRRSALQEGKLDRYVHRMTTKEKLVPDKPKSRAKKTLAPIILQQSQASIADSHRPPMPLRESTRIYEPENTPMQAKRRKQRGGETTESVSGGTAKKTLSSPKREVLEKQTPEHVHSEMSVNIFLFIFFFLRFYFCL